MRKSPSTQTDRQRAAALNNLSAARTPEAQRRRRLGQIAHEESQAEALRSQGYEVFSPTVVCDRVAVKDGKVYFVEFKKRGQELREGQAIVQALVPGNYLIIYS